MRRVFKSASVLLTFLLHPTNSNGQVSQNLLSESQPQWELGAGFITLNTPDYPGSNNNRLRVVPFPYYIYRGKYFRADDEGTRARLLSSKRHETGLSFGFNFPVNSGDNPSRQGMPNLDALISIGPRVLFRLFPGGSNHKLNFSFATRWVFSSKFSFSDLFRAQGLSFEPRLSYWYYWSEYRITFFTSFGCEFGTSRYTGFFYNVDPLYQTPERPTHTSKAGLIESSISGGLGKRINDKLFLFTGVSHRNLDWAANKNSPLVETKNNLGFIFGLVWTFLESEEEVVRL